MVASTSELTYVRYSRRPSQGVILGIDRAGVWSVALVVVPALSMFLFAGILQGVFAAILLSPLLVGGLVKRHGVALTTWAVWAARFKIQKVSGMTKYRKKPAPVTIGKLELPGLGARLEVWETPEGHAVIWDRRTNSASVTCMVATPGIARHRTQVMTPVERESYTQSLMQVAGSWTRRKQIARVSFLERTRPGTVVNELRHFEALGKSGELADSYREALRHAESQAVLRPQAVTVTIDTTNAAGREAVKANGGGKAGVLALVQHEMSATAESLLQAGFTAVVWCTPREWGAWGRGIIDPVSEAKVDVRLGTAFEGVAPELATPMSFDVEKDHVETDSAFHRVYWVAEWPRLEVLPGFMGEIAFAESHAGLPVRHALQIVGVPVPLEQALKRIRDERTTWKQNATLRARRGNDSSIADNADWLNLDAREQDLINGQGELAWTGYIAVSALTREALHSACSSMEIAASSASIELVSLTYQQGSALLGVAYPAGLGAR